MPEVLRSYPFMTLWLGLFAYSILSLDVATVYTWIHNYYLIICLYNNTCTLVNTTVMSAVDVIW